MILSSSLHPSVNQHLDTIFTQYMDSFKSIYLRHISIPKYPNFHPFDPHLLNVLCKLATFLESFHVFQGLQLSPLRLWEPTPDKSPLEQLGNFSLGNLYSFRRYPWSLGSSTVGKKQDKRSLWITVHTWVMRHASSKIANPKRIWIRELKVFPPFVFRCQLGLWPKVPT